MYNKYYKYVYVTCHTVWIDRYLPGQTKPAILNNGPLHQIARMIVRRHTVIESNAPRRGAKMLPRGFCQSEAHIHTEIVLHGVPF